MLIIFCSLMLNKYFSFAQYNVKLIQKKMKQIICYNKLIFIVIPEYSIIKNKHTVKVQPATTPTQQLHTIVAQRQSDNQKTMQEKKPNFIQQMRKKLNAYHVQRLHKLEQHHKQKQYYKQENKVKDMLIQLDQSQGNGVISNNCQGVGGVGGVGGEYSGVEEITGWNSVRPTLNSNSNSSNNNKDGVGNGDDGNNMDRRSMGVRRNGIYSVPSKTGMFQNVDKQKRLRNPDIINYLKTLLNRLQSPKVSKRCIKTENIKASDDHLKIKNTEPIHQFKKPKNNLLASRVNQKIPQNPQKQQKQIKSQRLKFQTIDLNTQNNPFTTTITAQSSRVGSNYQKIKRKSSNINNNNQYQIDIAREKDILQQLIRGNSAHYNSHGNSHGNSHANSNSNHQKGIISNNGQQYHRNSLEKFTLKNLLC